MAMKKQFISRMIFIFVIFTFMTLSVYSQEKKPNVKDHFLFFGPICSSYSISGDFKGTDYFQIGNMVGAIPKIDNMIAYGFIIGYRVNQLSTEFALAFSVPKVSYNGNYPKDLFFNVNPFFDIGKKEFDKIFYNDKFIWAGFSEKYYFRKNKKIQPFAELGFDKTWFVVNSDAAKVGGTFGSSFISFVDYKSVGVHLGAGASFYPIKYIGITPLIRFNSSFYNQINWSRNRIGNELDILPKSLHSNALNFSIYFTVNI